MSILARRAGAAFAMVAAAAGPNVAIARGVAVHVTIVTPVAATATAVMPSALWHRLVARYVGGVEVPIDGSTAPTVADCRAAGSDLLVTAPFALAPKLPGLPGSSDGRVSATTHIVAISCATGAVVLDRVVPLESDPPSDEEAGDFERDPELVWDHGVAVALARDRIDNALVRRQATIALAAANSNVGPTTSSAPKTHGSQIPVYAAAPAAPAVRPATSTKTPSHVAAPAARVATRDVPSVPVARLIDLIDVSRIAGVTQPFAILNVRDPSLRSGDRLVDFADAGHVLRAVPIELTVTENFGTYVQIVFDATGDAPVPAKGDLVQKASPTP